MAEVVIPNGSFEFGGFTIGSADGWTKNSSVADMLPACFDGLVILSVTVVEGVGVEGFEVWGGGELGTLDGAIVAEFTSGEIAEDFESEWLNSLFFFEFEVAILAAAVFNAVTVSPILFDGFEAVWNNDSFIFDWSGVTAITAMFDAAVPEGFEDFEEEWLSNEDFDFDWTSVTSATATFDGPDLFESFERVWPSVLDI